MNNTRLLLGERRVALNFFQRYSSEKCSGKKDNSIISSECIHFNKKNKRYKEIPTTKRRSIVSNLFHMLQSGRDPYFHEYIHKQHMKLGPIFREHMGDRDVIFISDPKLQSKIYNLEGKYPRHSLPEPWILFNKLNQNPRGLFFMDGEEWLKYRRIMNTLFLRVDHEYIDRLMATPSRHVAQKYANAWAGQKTVEDLHTQSYQWSVECVVAGLVGTGNVEELGHLEKDIKELGVAALDIFAETVRLGHLPPEWSRTLRLEAWSNFESAISRALILAKSIRTSIAPIAKKYDGILSKMMAEDIPEKDIDRIVVDLIIGAGDTTALSLQWALYLLCRHPDVQEKLRNTVLDSSCKKDYEDHYVKAVVREILRVYPIAAFISRIIPEDSILLDYQLKKESHVCLSIYSSGLDPNCFPDPEKFWPERWLRGVGGKYQGALNPQTITPFAIGSRSCLGRKYAEIMMAVTLSEMVKHLKIELVNNREVKMHLRLVMVPESPINLKITKLPKL